MTEPVNEAEVRAIVKAWGELHDLQAGLSAFLPFIAAEGFYMEFAGKRWEGYAGFERHQVEKRRFFDELHETVELKVTPGTPVTRAWTRSHWNARYRPEASPVSRQIKTLIEHDWEFRRDAAGRAFMQGHTVTRFEYLPGFAPDETPEYDPHLEPRR
ncbi:MAG: hypothetical protein LCH95_20180 [Proteobacteria bacterium]|nr:hypothetical protein [Pseudomonadota bacterium]